jgi:hypothetical protein
MKEGRRTAVHACHKNTKKMSFEGEIVWNYVGADTSFAYVACAHLVPTTRGGPSPRPAREGVRVHTDIQLYGTAEFQNAARACSADRR